MLRLRVTSMLWAVMLAAGAVVGADDPKAGAAKPPSLDDLFPDKVIARAKGFEIKASLVEEEFVAFKQTMAMQNKPVPEEQRTEFEARILERLIVIKLLVARAIDVDKTNAHTKVDKFFEETKANAGGEEAMARALRAQGQSVDTFKNKTYERALADEVFIREVREKITIPPEQVKKFYDENPKRFEQPEIAKLSHILFTTTSKVTGQPMNDEQIKKQREMAENVLKMAQNGDDFKTLVEKFSDDTNSKAQGGEYVIARGQMTPEFEAAAFALAPNQISPLVSTKFGFHIIRMIEKTPAKIVEFDKKVQDDVRNHLAQLEADKQMPEYVERIKKEAGVEILDEKYNLKIEPAVKPKS